MKKTTRRVSSTIAAALICASIVGGAAATASASQITQPATSVAVQAKTQGKNYTKNFKENPSTGYSWFYKLNNNNVKVKESYVSPTTTGQEAGVPVTHKYTFSARKKSSSTVVTFKLKKGNEVAKSFKLFLNIDKNGNVKAAKNYTKNFKENPSTGYTWSYKISNKNVRVNEKFVSSNDNNQQSGVPVTHKFTFIANKTSAKTTVTFKLKRGSEVNKTVKVNLKIDNKGNVTVIK